LPNEVKAQLKPQPERNNNNLRSKTSSEEKRKWYFAMQKLWLLTWKLGISDATAPQPSITTVSGVDAGGPIKAGSRSSKVQHGPSLISEVPV
jgi:hypothetical protein